MYCNTDNSKIVRRLKSHMSMKSLKNIERDRQDLDGVRKHNRNKLSAA